MKFCIVGAGAIGGMVGVRLAHIGHEVSVILRGANLEAVRANGMTLIEENGSKLILAGSSGSSGNVAGISGGAQVKGSTARFNTPIGIAVDSTGDVFVAVFSANGALRWVRSFVVSYGFARGVALVPDGGAERGIVLSTVNLGGGFPAKYLRKTPRLARGLELVGGFVPLVLHRPEREVAARHQPPRLAARPDGHAADARMGARSRARPTWPLLGA